MSDHPIHTLASMNPPHFTPADKPLADTFAAVLEDTNSHALVHDLHDPDVGRSPEDRYELAALLAVVARRHAIQSGLNYWREQQAGTDSLPPT